MLAVLDALKGFDGTESLREVTVPVLLVVGGRDKSGMAASRQTAALLRDSEVAVIEGAGAVLNAEAPRSSPTSPPDSSTRRASIKATPTVAPAKGTRAAIRCEGCGSTTSTA